MRRAYLVCYDICDPRRLQRVHRAMKGFGQPWQYSVFYCVLKDIDRVRMQAALESEMNLKDDQSIIVDLGSNLDAAIESVTTLGCSLPDEERKTIVI